MNVLVNMVKGEVFDSFIDNNIKNRLNMLGTVSYNETETQSVPDLSDVDVLITGWGQKKISKSEVGERLKLIVHTGGTVGNLVNTDVFDTGVKVLSGNQYYAESVAEGVIAYMLFALRDMGFYSSELRNGIWYWDGKTEGLLDQTVGIISLGAISKKVIELAKPFRLKLKVFSTHPNDNLAEEMGFKYASREEIFSTCKIVSVHTAANAETENFINCEHFSLLQEGSIFLNTARGSVINEADLVEALKTKRFKAVLDVFNEEPLPKGHPFLNMENVILFPHQAGPTYDRRVEITNYLIDDIEAFFKGLPVKNEITKDVAMMMTQT